MENIIVTILKYPDNLQGCFDVRYNVFVEEQKFAAEIELDEYDNVANHVLIKKDDKPIATARFFKVDDIWKIGRVCVIKEYRYLKLGSALMDSIEKHLVNLDVAQVCLSSQMSASGFYKKNGYIEVGEIYLDEGCEHIKMIKQLLCEKI